MKKYNHPLSHYAKSYGVSLGTIKRYSAQGWPLDDPAALRKRLGENKHAPAGLEADDKKALQIRKLKAECVRLERENAIKSGELLPLAEYMEINARLDAEICKGLDDLPIEAAPKVYGLKTVAEITVKLREITDRIKSALYAPVREPKTAGGAE